MSKGSIKFSCQGDIGNGQVTLKPYDDPENPNNNVSIELSQGVTLSFSLKYLVNFTKATPLSGSVTLRLLENMPVLVEYNMEGVGHLQYYPPIRLWLTPVSSLLQNQRMRIRYQVVVDSVDMYDNDTYFVSHLFQATLDTSKRYPLVRVDPVIWLRRQPLD